MSSEVPCAPRTRTFSMSAVRVRPGDPANQSGGFLSGQGQGLGHGQSGLIGRDDDDMAAGAQGQAKGLGRAVAEENGTGFGTAPRPVVTAVISRAGVGKTDSERNEVLDRNFFGRWSAAVRSQG